MERPRISPDAFCFDDTLRFFATQKHSGCIIRASMTYSDQGRRFVTKDWWGMWGEGPVTKRESEKTKKRLYVHDKEVVRLGVCKCGF